jgi:hypothetical protein
VNEERERESRSYARPSLRIRNAHQAPGIAPISTLELALGVIGKTVVMDSKPFVFPV